MPTLSMILRWEGYMLTYGGRAMDVTCVRDSGLDLFAPILLNCEQVRTVFPIIRRKSWHMVYGLFRRLHA